MRFFVPALLSSLGLAIGAVADCVYIGKMMNEDGLYIVGVTSPIYMIFTTWSVALAVGGSIHFSKVLGEGDVKQARTTFLSTIVGDFIGLCLLAAAGLLFMEPLMNLLGVSAESVYHAEVAGYARYMLICCPIFFMQAPLQYFVHADDNPTLASWALVLGCVADCLCGYLFIVVMEAGVVGSIWSTLAGALAMELTCLCHFFFGKGCLHTLSGVRLSLRTAVHSFKTGFSTATQYLYKFIVLLVFNRILLRISGESAVAIYDISVNAVSLVTAVIDAVVLAMIPMISTFFGERNRNDIRHCLWVSVRSGLLTTGAVALALILLSPQFCAFLGLSPELVADGAFAIRIVVISSVIACINNILTTFFQNIGSEKASFRIVFFREFAVLLICGYLCSGPGFEGFWYAYVITELLVLIGVLCVVFYRRNVQKKQIIQFEEGEVFAETFEGSHEKISDTCERIQEFLEQAGASMKQAYFVTLTVDEICRLIAENTGNLMLQLTLVDTRGEYILHIRDNAGKFNPLEVNDEDEHGLGLRVVKKQAKEYYYRQFVGFNTLTVSFAKEG